MVIKNYNWEDGAVLEEHTKKKHEILRTYFHQYLKVRCQVPKQENFRLAVIDGFSGAGFYKCGSFGSPVIFIDVLVKTIKEINFYRLSNGIRPIRIECFFIFNDLDKVAVEQLRKNTAALILKSSDESGNQLFIKAEYLNNKFNDIFPKIKNSLITEGYRNVFFNLDQCGYSHVPTALIRDIMGSWRSAEVILTFMIESLLAFLSPDKNKSELPLENDLRLKIDLLLDNSLSKKQWLGEAEKVVYSHFKSCASYVSPFSINNPSGWQYWMMHFSSSYRARQVYNDILHQSGAQAHYGRAGLNMLSYSPDFDCQLYLFDNNSRIIAKEALYDDIPRLVEGAGDVLSMHDFYSAAYNETPAHSQDIHDIIMENDDLEVITESGGKRRQSNTIKFTDILKLKKQRSLFFMLPYKK